MSSLGSGRGTDRARPYEFRKYTAGRTRHWRIDIGERPADAPGSQVRFVRQPATGQNVNRGVGRVASDTLAYQVFRLGLDGRWL